MSQWVIYNKKCDEKKIAEDFQISPLLVRILNNRGIDTYDGIKYILSSNINDLRNEELLPNIKEAAKILIEKINSNKSICIIGDYDIDGIIATYILYDVLRKIGANVSYHIPHRIKDGYGINKRIIDLCIEENVDTIITCDNGIAAIEEIKYAKENNITVIVTDHHEVGDILPNADVIINPKLKSSKYPFKEICGGVVAWKFTRYIKRMLDKTSFNDFDYIEFAALATIGDIMPLLDENHIIAKIGLDYMKNTKNKGLQKLIEISQLNNKNITSYHVGFIIGPLINAAGRLDHAEFALKIFLEEDENEISNIANKLKQLNDDRKKMTEDGVKKAIELIEKNYSNDKILVLYLEKTNEAVSGIIAGRLKELYNKPSIVLTDTIEDNVLKASCRSIDNYDIYEGLAKHRDLYLKFGGHKGAAGFSIYKNDIEKLRLSLNEECLLKEEEMIKKIYIDAEVPIYMINENIIKDLEKLEPCGQKLDKAVLACRNIEFFVDKVFGENQNVIKLSLKKDDIISKGVIFESYEKFQNEVGENKFFDILYYPNLNIFQNYTNLEINVKNYRISSKMC